MNACAGCLEPRPHLWALLVAGQRHLLCAPCRRAVVRARSGKRSRAPVKARLFEPAADSDWIWLLGHHGRNHRIREPVGGEALMMPPAPEGTRLIVVRQIRPGVRIETSVAWPADAPTPLNSEQNARELYDALRTPELDGIEARLMECAG